MEIFEMSNDEVHLWNFSLYKFYKNDNVTSAIKNICNMYNKYEINIKINHLFKI